MIENPVTGERMAFHVTGAADADRTFRAELFVRPYGAVAGPHVHAEQEERVLVHAGQLRYRIGDDERALGPHQTVSIPAGAPHVWWNAGDTEAHVQVELRPGRGAEALYARLFALARDGKTDEHATPGLVERAALAREHGYYAVGLPLAVQIPLLAIVERVARALGARAPRASG